MERYSKTRLRTGLAQRDPESRKAEAAPARRLRNEALSPEDILAGDDQLELPFAPRKKR